MSNLHNACTRKTCLTSAYPKIGSFFIEALLVSTTISIGPALDTHLGVGSEGLHPLPVESEPPSDGPHHVGVVAVRVLRHEEREAVDDQDEGGDDVEVPRLRPDLVDLEVLVLDVDVAVVAAAFRDRSAVLRWNIIL